MMKLKRSFPGWRLDETRSDRRQYRSLDCIEGDRAIGLAGAPFRQGHGGRNGTRGNGGSRPQAGPDLPTDILIVESKTPLDPLLSEMLDRGEAGVIQTAFAQAIPQVLIDEKKGRKVARLYGLQVFGTARLLLEGKRAGLIDSVGQALEAMRSNGYWIDDKIVRWAKTIADEDVADG